MLVARQVVSVDVRVTTAFLCGPRLVLAGLRVMVEKWQVCRYLACANLDVNVVVGLRMVLDIFFITHDRSATNLKTSLEAFSGHPVDILYFVLKVCAQLVNYTVRKQDVVLSGVQATDVGTTESWPGSGNLPCSNESTPTHPQRFSW